MLFSNDHFLVQLHYLVLNKVLFSNSHYTFSDAVLKNLLFSLTAKDVQNDLMVWLRDAKDRNGGKKRRLTAQVLQENINGE